MARPTNDQLHSLGVLFSMAQGDHGGAIVARKFLLSLYNGRRFPFDLTDLRLLDMRRFEQCLEVLRMDYTPAEEVHVTIGRYFNPAGKPVGGLFERWAYDMRLPGRAKKDQIADYARRERGEPA